ncbi:hypothetical protein WA026_018606 [Henosepilachna vigintioctopunctata]|uniref:Uncharacterized protein n=1 Tax=Henosepilachna vigintioctopunctata TaxID=420089 RepID=A0AAW1U4U6_9CUCU
MNDFSSSDSNMVNLSQHNSITTLSTQNASMEEISASACDELYTKFRPYSNNITDKEIVEENHQSSNKSLKFIPSILNLKNILKSEEVAPIVPNKVSVDNNDSKNFDGKMTKKRFVMHKWKKKILNELDATQNSLPNQDDTSSIVNNVLEANENEQIRNMTNQPPQISPKVVKVNPNKIRKNTTNKLGIHYYMKLLNKIDWDLSKSISNVNPDEIQSQPENTKLVEQVQSPLCVENKMYSLESIDLSRSISNFNIDNILSQYENENLVGQVESPLDVQNKMRYLENIDVSNYISNPDEVQSQSGNEELVRQEKAPLCVENKMNSLENIDMSSSVTSTLIDLTTKRKRKRKHKKKIRPDKPATVNSFILHLPNNIPWLKETRSFILDSKVMRRIIYMKTRMKFLPNLRILAKTLKYFRMCA